jgi:hypothetical protein
MMIAVSLEKIGAAMRDRGKSVETWLAAVIMDTPEKKKKEHKLVAMQHRKEDEGLVQ